MVSLLSHKEPGTYEHPVPRWWECCIAANQSGRERMLFPGPWAIPLFQVVTRSTPSEPRWQNPCVANRTCIVVAVALHGAKWSIY